MTFYHSTELSHCAVLDTRCSNCLYKRADGLHVQGFIALYNHFKTRKRINKSFICNVTSFKTQIKEWKSIHIIPLRESFRAPCDIENHSWYILTDDELWFWYSNFGLQELKNCNHLELFMILKISYKCQLMGSAIKGSWQKAPKHNLKWNNKISCLYVLYLRQLYNLKLLAKKVCFAQIPSIDIQCICHRIKNYLKLFKITFVVARFLKLTSLTTTHIDFDVFS